MANNKYNNHSQAANEDMIEQRLVAANYMQQNFQQPQQQPHPQRHFGSEPGYCLPKSYYNSNFQKLVMKSTLNPNAQEFVPSYVETAKNGYIHPINNCMRISGPDYKFGFWSNLEFENKFAVNGKYLQGKVQRSNTVLPLIFENNRINYDNSVDGQSIKLEGSTTSNEICSPSNGSDILKSGENVWFIDKRIETSKNNSVEWASQGEIIENPSKGEYYDALVTWTENTDAASSGKSKYEVIEDENRKRQEEEIIVAQKKLIMLYPTKRQNEIIAQGSQESIFEDPNPISYTSDESFLTQSNTNSSFNENVEQLIENGKQFFTNNPQASNDVLDELKDLSEDIERTAKQTDSQSSESVNEVTSKCVIEQKSEKQTTNKNKLVSKENEIGALKIPKMEKSRKVNNLEASKIDTVTQQQKGLNHCKESKGKQSANSSITSSRDTSSKIRTLPGDDNSSKESDSNGKAAVKMNSITGTIPKTKENIAKPTRKPTLGNGNGIDATVKNARNTPKTVSTKKEEKESDIRNQRPSNETNTQRPQANCNMRKIEAGSNNSNNNNNSNSNTETKPIVKKEVEKTQKRSILKMRTSSNTQSEKKSVLIKTVETISPQPKSTTSNSQSHANTSNTTNKKNVTILPVLKSVIKTQMRTPTNYHPQTQTKKIIVINNAPKKDKESKKPKASNVGHGHDEKDKRNKTAASTKIPVRQKTTSHKGQRAVVVGSDGDNNKIGTSRSCISLWSCDRKNFADKTSKSNTQIGDKLSENKTESASKKIANSSTHSTSLKKETLA